MAAQWFSGMLHRTARRWSRHLRLETPVFFLSGQPTSILMYHGVVPKAVNPKTWVQLELPRFRSQMQYLADHRPVVTLEDMVEAVRGRRRLPSGAVAITFDDGYYNVLEHALPVLSRYRIPATVFVTAGLVGTDRLLWTDQVYECLLSEAGSEGEREDVYARVAALKRLPDFTRRQEVQKIVEGAGGEPRAGRDHPWRIVDEKELNVLAASELITIGAHTVTHPILPNQPHESARWEIRESKSRLEALTGRATRLFAYPDGACNTAIARMVEQAGFVAAVSTRIGRVTSYDDLYNLGRYPVGGDISLQRFAYLLAGLDEWTTPWRSRLRFITRRRSASRRPSAILVSSPSEA